MTINDIKRLDRRLREITEPFGTGFPTLRKVVTEMAEKNEISNSEVMRTYIAWKWRK